MPGWCAANSCSNERTKENRSRGITFHKFPRDVEIRKKWEVALRREGFVATDHSIICSQHFKQADFDRTGQIVRLRDGVIPSLFNFPVHLQKSVKGRATSTAREAEESLCAVSDDPPEMATPQPQPNEDHSYTLSTSPTALKAKLEAAMVRVGSLEREKRNAISREKRAKLTVKSLLGELREQNLLTKSTGVKMVPVSHGVCYKH
ncbi:THAP domain-containing protein 6-like isoform X2 [Cololabis saira]|uniref:THAP domain-containing protein 6-like isoform X2 n=1 Tax=Cololabis saira TaxID=129043 RepID=UPI002AD54836|nr:THAP domain-containing protein 6-like isoform X2 [Cololabis saira]